MAPPNSQARQQRVDLKIFIPNSFFFFLNSRPLCCLHMSDLISSGTAIQCQDFMTAVSGTGWKRGRGLLLF